MPGNSHRPVILDAHALLAYFQKERGADAVEAVLQEAEVRQLRLLMSVINWGEVYYSVVRSHGRKQAQETLTVIDQLPIHLIEATKPRTLLAAELKAVHKLAYGDCFAAALAMEFNGEVLTGDREFTELGSRVKVHWTY